MFSHHESVLSHSCQNWAHLGWAHLPGRQNLIFLWGALNPGRCPDPRLSRKPQLQVSSSGAHLQKDKFLTFWEVRLSLESSQSEWQSSSSIMHAQWRGAPAKKTNSWLFVRCAQPKESASRQKSENLTKGRSEEDDEVGFPDLKMERTCQKDKFLTFWEVRPSQNDFQIETEGDVDKLKLPGLERTWKKDKILTSCEVRPSQMDIQFEAKC